MRIVIDLQAAQTGSRFRGIGHYATDLVKAMIAEGSAHEFYLVLNGYFSDTIEPIRASFDGILPQSNIRVWYAPGEPERFSSEEGSLRETAQIIREYYLRSLDPDVVLLTSMFEGLGDDAVITVGEHVRDLRTAAIFYDFTPLILPDEHFKTEVMHRRWYRHRISQLRRCDLLLAISESSGSEAIGQLSYPSDQVVSILGGVNPNYVKRDVDATERSLVLSKYGINKPFLLYTGGVEKNKNLSKLIEALSLLPARMKENFELVVVGKRYPGQAEAIRSMARDAQSLQMVKVVGFVPHEDLVILNVLADLFVFPSLREGLGLPPLEAMACGTPTIVSDRTSLPELVDNEEALFDPTSAPSIAAKIAQALNDPDFRQRLVEKGLARASQLTWQASARTALNALESRFGRRDRVDRQRQAVIFRTSQFEPRPLRILAMKLDHNGDFLLALPALSKLRARYPDAEIHALVGSWNRAAAEASKLFDSVFCLDFYKGQSAARPALDDEAFDAMLDRMPYYDFAIDFRRQPDTRFILTRLKAGKYFGYRVGDQKIDQLLTEPLKIFPDEPGIRSLFDETHICAQMLKIVDALPFDPRDYVALPELGPRLTREQGAVAVFPRVGLDARQWDTGYFEQLVRFLANQDSVTNINIYAAKLEDLQIFDFGQSSKINYRVGLNFQQLYSSLSANQVCVGNNSFGVHLAGYAGCKTLGIYSGHEVPEQWGPPFGDSAVITVDAVCAPCHLPDRPSCPFNMFCLNDISVDAIQRAVLSAISGSSLVADYSRITAADPSSVIKPLTDAINKAKFEDRITEFDDKQLAALGTAIATNFPERSAQDRLFYVDVSGLLELDVAARSNQRHLEVRNAIECLSDTARGRVKLIASGPEDREFYFVDLENLTDSLATNDRSEHVVFPVAGDVYCGLHAYLNRTSAQWNLLMTWRELGVRTLLAAPSFKNLPAPEAEEESSRALAAYLFTIANFDAIICAEDDCSRLLQWVAVFGPPRLRRIRCGANLAVLVEEHGGRADFDVIAPESLTGQVGRQNKIAKRRTVS